MALIIVLTLLAGALLAPGLPIGPSLDAAVFSHVGGRILDGVAPYVGAWDHKPPGIYLATAAAQALLGWLGPWTAGWLLSLAATVGLGAAVAAVLARLGVTGWPRTLAAAGAVVLAGQYLLALGGGLTEPLATAFVAWALVLVPQTTAGGRLAVAGTLLAAGLLCSLQVLPGVFVVLALAGSGRRLARVALLAAGLAAPIILVTGWLAFAGALPDAIDAIVTYTGAYRASNAGFSGQLSGPVIAWTLLAMLFLITPAAIGARSGLRTAGDRRAIAGGMLVWIGTALVMFLVQGRFLAHYAIPLSVPLGTLAGLGLQLTAARLRGRRSRGRSGALLAPLLLGAITSLAAGAIAARMELTNVARDVPSLTEVATYLRQESAASDTIFVWGNQPRLYDVAGRDPATRYSYFYSLTTPGYTTSTAVEELARELAARPPALVIDAGSNAPGEPGFLPLLMPRPVVSDGRNLDLLDPLREFVRSRYELLRVVDGWPVYRLRGGSEG